MFSPSNVFAEDPPQSEYEAALKEISDGAYYLVTEVGETKWYVTQSGYLTEDKDGAYLFAISKVDASGAADRLFDTAWKIEPGNGSHFSNTTLTDNKALLHPTETGYRQDGSNNREDWERQLFYLNPETGKYAIRSCNTSYAEESWRDAGRAFWTWEVEDPEAEYLIPKPCYSYEVAYIWSLEVPADKDQIHMALEGIYNSYENQILDDVDEPETVNMGTEFGQLADWDTWRKFKAEVDKLPDLLDKFFDEAYDPAEDPDCPDLDGANAWKAEIDSMWQVVLNSEVPYKLPNDGYYRIITRMRYYTDNEIRDEESGELIDTERTYVTKAALASYDKNYPGNVMFGTLRNDRANFVWKLTQVGDSILMQNVGMETYPNIESSDRFLLTDDPTKISHVMFDYAANDIVDIDDEDQDFRDIFYIRLASDPRHVERYLHQNGHSRGKDSHKDLDMGFWRGTYDMGGIYETDEGTSEWYLEPVSEDEVAELVEKFQPILHHDVLVQQNQELRDEVAAAIVDAKDSKLITSADLLSSPHSDSAEGTNLNNLIDGDKSSFWHSDWHGEKPEGMHIGLENEPEHGYHFLLLSEMQDMVGECELYICQRNSGDDHPQEIRLFGSNDANASDEEWVEMATLIVPKTGSAEECTVPFNVETAYPYVRFVVTNTVGASYAFRTFWHAAEIQITLKNGRPTSQFYTLGEIATNLEKVLEKNRAVADEDVDLAIYEELLNAYELFKGGLVDASELRSALAKFANTTKGVVEGTEPGQWTSTDIAKAYNRLYSEAKSYYEASKFTPEQVHEYAVMLKAMSKSVAEQANGVKTGTWYRIMFPTEEMYTDFGFDPNGAGGKSELVEDQAYQWGNFVAFAQQVTEDGEPDEEGNPTTVQRLEVVDTEEISNTTRPFFMADDEITDKDASKFRFVELPAETPDFAGVFSEVMENTAVALELSTTYTKGDALITDVKQLSSNASDEAEGKNLGDLIDGNPGTFWHSDWHQKVKDPHYLQVALNEPVSGLVQVEITRRNTTGGGHIIHMYIQGSTDGEAWTNVGYMVTPYDGVANSVVSSQPIDLGAGSFKYLRFILGRRSNLDVELDPFAVPSSASVYDKDWSYFHAAEFQIYPVTADKELSAGAKALQETYNSLHKVVNIYREPTSEQFATAFQTYKTFKDDFNTSVGKAVLPNGPDKPAPSYAIQNKATGLFINAAGGNTNDIFLKLTPTFFDYKALGYQRSLLHGKNIDGTDCTNLHSGNSNHRLCTWSSTEPNSNSGLVIREAEAVEPADFTFNLSINNGEIYDFCSTVSITNKGDGVAYVGLGQYTDTEGVTYLALKKVETIEAGQPAFYILGDTTQYDAEEDPELVKFAMAAEPEFKFEGETVNGFIGCLVNHTLGVNDIFFDANYASATGKTGYYQPAPCVVVDMSLCPEVDPTAAYDFSICLDNEDAVDGIKDVASTIKKISQPGDVYSIDGKLLKTGATLNNLKSLGQGTYILNGVKIMVK